MLKLESSTQKNYKKQIKNLQERKEWCNMQGKKLADAEVYEEEHNNLLR